MTFSAIYINIYKNKWELSKRSESTGQMHREIDCKLLCLVFQFDLFLADEISISLWKFYNEGALKIRDE